MEGPTALAGEAVTVQQLVDGAWIPAARTFAGQDGRYSAFAWIDGAVTLRPVVRQSDRVLVGTNATVTVGAARRTLHQRATELRGIYGTTSAARALSAKQRAKAGARSATSVHYRNLDGGPMLVEIARGATTETWLVKGAIKRYYQSHGGPSGNLGLPIQDPRCSLPGGGCLQTFTRGTVYSLPGEVAATPLTGAGGDIVAALRTQVGFKQQGSHDGPRVATKYQLWADSEASWCSIFLAWGAYRTGHDDAIPKHRHFREYRDYLRRDVKRLRGPTPGALVIMNGGEVLGHAAIVTSVDKHRRTIQIIDGNWSMRVRETRVPIAKNMEFYWPY
jgi:hypothetical protein